MELAGNLEGGGQGGQTVGKVPHLEEKIQHHYCCRSSPSPDGSVFFFDSPYFSLLFLPAVIPHQLFVEAVMEAMEEHSAVH